jgi:hypothetical protein
MLQIQESNDATPFSQVGGILASAVVTAANTPIQLEIPTQMDSLRVLYTPGANAANITAAMSLHTS